MTMKMLVQRCMVIFAIFLCYVHARPEDKNEKKYVVNCEVQVYHPQCRGMQSRKRGLALYPTRGLGCGGSNSDLDCGLRLLGFRERPNHIPNVALSRSKLWRAFLNDDLQGETGYDAYPSSYESHRKKVDGGLDNEYDSQRIPMMQNFWSELEAADNDY